MITLRDGTVDDYVWNRAMEREYPWLGPMHHDSVVLDLGAHIGAFSKYAYGLGSRKIYAYEAASANCSLAVANLGTLGALGAGVTLYHAAVVGSPATQVAIGDFPIDDGTVNTGGASLVLGTDAAEWVRAIHIDDAIDGAMVGEQKIHALKIDIEGAEWEALYSSRRMDVVYQIFGEYHYLPRDVEVGLKLPYEASMRGLRAWLEAEGFTIDVISDPRRYQRPGSGPIGYFRAVRGTL